MVSLHGILFLQGELVKIFEHGNVTILKLGLHPSEGLLSGDDLIAGPFHRSFRELVMTEIWWEELNPLMEKSGNRIEIRVAPDQLNFAVGYCATNKVKLSEKFQIVKFHTASHLKGKQITLKIS